MKKLSLYGIASVMCLLPAMAGAQVKPVTPVEPAAPVQAVTPVAPAVVVPMLSDLYQIDMQALKERAQELAEQSRSINMDAVRAAADAARQQAEDLRAKTFADMRVKGDFAIADKFDFDRTFGQAFAQTMSTGADAERSYYDRGQSAISQRQYEQAITRFDQAINAKGTRTDGALYWKAYAQYKLGRSADANATLGELLKSYKESKYAQDARMLEAEVKKSAGQAVRPENEDDEDLKLLAIQSLQSSDPERAVPLLQGVLNSTGSMKLKERALYVLALSSQPQAHTMLVGVAKSGNPDLQIAAIRQLGNSYRGKNQTTPTELMDIYNNAQSNDVKLAIIRSFGSSGDRSALVNIITAPQGASVVDLRREAVNQLGSAQGGPELWTIYQKEQDKQIRMQILSSLANMGAYDKVIEVAKSEKDPELRNRALRSLGNMRADRSGAALQEIYPSLGDNDAKKSVISGLANQNNAEGLIAIYRKETNFELKKSIVSMLGNMPKNKAAQDFLMEILK